MGTHPIFESDFDCLTELDVASAASVARHPVPNTSPRLDQLASSAGRQKDGFDEGNYDQLL